MFELESNQPREMLATVVSATTRHGVFLLPEWSKSIALCISSSDPQWPRIGKLRPAVNMRYICTVNMDGPVPVPLAWRLAPSEGRPSPLPAPAGLPGPPDLLPVNNDDALIRTITKHLGTMSLDQRTRVAYLVRRAYGQGLAERIRS
jgi:hypothetical protein